MRRLHELDARGALWLTGAAVLGLSRNRAARRAALRGVGSLALVSAATSVAANIVVRPLTGRLSKRPVSSPLPSGRSASAAAFATAVALESPWLGAAFIPVAAAVAASRVCTGARHPGEVLLGVAAGVGVAAATCRWWPLHMNEPAESARPNVPVPALPAGKGLITVINSGAGSAANVEAELRALLPEAELRVCEIGDDLPDVLAKAAKDVLGQGDQGAQRGALGVAGGDGTLNAAAVVAAENGLPLAVFPAGTLNHFTADLGILTLRSTAEAVEAGCGGAVDLGRVTGDDGRSTYFLNTFSIGVYPELVRVREALETRVGKWPALAVGLLRVLADGRPTKVTVDGQPRRLWLLFAGNGRYDPPGFAPSYRRRLDDGLLDIRAVDGDSPFARTRLVAVFLTGTLARSRVYQAATVTRLRIDGVGEQGDYARDGEVSPAAETLLLDKSPRVLTVYLPAP